MIETCTQCKQKTEIPADKWVCSYCEAKAAQIAKEFGDLAW